MVEIYPCTVTLDRYCGSYASESDKPNFAVWTAWNMEPNEIPEGPFADDVGYYDFWRNNTIPVGRGRTPNEAIADLIKKLGM